MSIKVCGHCGKTSDTVWFMCPLCGYPYQEDDENSEPSADNSLDYRPFGKHVGKMPEVESKVCSHCGRSIDTDWIICPVCGHLCNEDDTSAELSRDICLSLESFEMIDPKTQERGGGGSETTFVASERKVVHKQWIYDPSTKRSSSDEEELKIPDSITTKEELCAFVSDHNPYWVDER